MSETSPPGAGSRRARYILIGSLALNLLFVGAFVGMGFKPHGPGGPHHAAREHFGLMGLTRVLPEERRKEVLEQLKKEYEERRPAMEDLHAARHEAADRLAAEPFDRASLEEALANVASREQALRSATVETFLAQAERLSAEERKLLSERWRKRADWMARHRGKESEGKK